MNRISLCVIARDEERFLPACLASVRGAVDEIVVVDTGSSDRTRELATEAGALVVDFAWCDDFAAARNAGLARAAGTHVLALDADERLASGAGDVLRKAADDPRLLVGMLPLHDADALDAREADVLSGARRISEPAWLPRFFRRHPRLVWRRRVHETILGELDLALAETKGRIAAVEAPIVHFGEVRALRAELGKHARNTRLLELALADDPADGEIAGFLALELARGGDLARAHALAEQHFAPFLARIDALPRGRHKPSPVQLAQVLATCQLKLGRPGEVLDTVRAALKRCDERHPNLVFLAGLARDTLGDERAAEQLFRECVGMARKRFTIPVDPNFTNGAPKLRLAQFALLRGESRAVLEILAGVGGSLDLAARLVRAEAHLVERDADAALRELAPLLVAKNPPPDLFAIAAWAAELTGGDEPHFATAARQAKPESWIEPRRKAYVAVPAPRD